MNDIDTHLAKINREAIDHLKGRSRFIDDIPELSGTLYGAVIPSPFAHARLHSLDLDDVRASEGVKAVLAAADVCGRNQIGPIVEDEPLFAEDTIHFRGQPLAFVVADSSEHAYAAASKVKIEADQLPVITEPKEAFLKGDFIIPPRTFQMGDTEKAFASCEYIIQGTVKSGAQEHLYMETQGAYVWPTDNGSIRIMSSTQGPSVVQRIAARVLGIPMNRIEVDVARIGGGFGGKEDQATPWAVMTALAALILDRPVKYILSREEDMRYTGKRHAYHSEYKIGLNTDLFIKAFDLKLFQNAGAAADLSPAILERSLLHVNNAYYLPNVKATAHSCRTNIAPATAFRGFGAPQAMFVIESAIHKAANSIGIDASEIQSKNLIRKGQQFYYGQPAIDCQIVPAWNQLLSNFEYKKEKQKIEDYNLNNTLFKKGLSLMPICFGISFTNTSMNHGRALVHVYQDGSVGISTGAVEMGQGVNTKLAQIAAKSFSIDIENIKLESTNTTRVANSSPSAASSTTDLNGHALINAIEQIKKRLSTHAADCYSVRHDEIMIKDGSVYCKGEITEMSWNALIQSAFLSRVNLSAKGHYVRPHIYFDKSTETGRPFAYHVYGVGMTEVTLDCLRGTYAINSVSIMHDCGTSFNPLIDIGQIEGALLQGIGWMSMEEIKYDKSGHLMSDSLSTYKIPDISFAPGKVSISFLQTDGNEQAVLKAKAVGEPPFMYGMGTYFALRNAMLAFRPNLQFTYNAPLTPEKILLAIYEP